MRRQSRGAEVEVAAMDVAERIMSEYRQFPGLRLTKRQAIRLWALDERQCEAVLGALVASGWLCLDSCGQYALPHTAWSAPVGDRGLEAVA